MGTLYNTCKLCYTSVSYSLIVLFFSKTFLCLIRNAHSIAWKNDGHIKLNTNSRLWCYFTIKHWIWITADIQWPSAPLGRVECQISHNMNIVNYIIYWYCSMALWCYYIMYDNIFQFRLGYFPQYNTVVLQFRLVFSEHILHIFLYIFKMYC